MNKRTMMWEAAVVVLGAAVAACSAPYGAVEIPDGDGSGQATTNGSPSSSNDTSTPNTRAPTASPAPATSTSTIPETVTPNSDAEFAADAVGKPATCTVSFTKDILPKLAAASCAASACHGTATPPLIDPSSASKTYAALTAFHLSNGVPYVQPKTAILVKSSMHCHLRGTCGTKMPPPGVTLPAGLLDATDSWLMCGAPLN